MGVSLSYRTAAPVATKVKAAILADAERINVERNWWCEGIIFFEERKGAKRLTGDTKLFFAAGIYSDEDAEGGCKRSMKTTTSSWGSVTQRSLSAS